MSAVKFQAEVVENVQVAPDICRMAVRWPSGEGLPAPRAGQFFMLLRRYRTHNTGDTLQYIDCRIVILLSELS